MLDTSDPKAAALFDSCRVLAKVGGRSRGDVECMGRSDGTARALLTDYDLAATGSTRVEALAGLLDILLSYAEVSSAESHRDLSLAEAAIRRAERLLSRATKGT